MAVSVAVWVLSTSVHPRTDSARPHRGTVVRRSGERDASVRGEGGSGQASNLEGQFLARPF